MDLLSDPTDPLTQELAGERNDKKKEEGAKKRDLGKHLIYRVNLLRTFLPRHYFPKSLLGNKE